MPKTVGRIMFRSDGLVNLQVVVVVMRGGRIKGFVVITSPSLTISGRVKQLTSAIQHAVREERHFALMAVSPMTIEITARVNKRHSSCSPALLPRQASCRGPSALLSCPATSFDHPA